MGSGFDVNVTPDETGIIPRAVEHLFRGIDERKKQAAERGDPLPDFKVNAQFMEVRRSTILRSFRSQSSNHLHVPVPVLPRSRRYN